MTLEKSKGQGTRIYNNNSITQLFKRIYQQIAKAKRNARAHWK